MVLKTNSVFDKIPKKGGKMKKFFTIILIFFSISTIFAQENKTTPAKKQNTIKIGVLFSLSGRTSALGVPEKNAIEMLAKEINEKGGILGKKIELLINDTKGKPEIAHKLAQKLIEQDKVIAIIGPTLSGPSLSIVNLANSTKTILISCAASIKIVEPAEERKWIFKTAQNDKIALLKIYSFLKDKGVKTIAFFAENNPFGKSGQIEFEKTVIKYGFTIVENEKFNPKGTDIEKKLSNIIKEKPDAIICWGTYPGPALVAKYLKENKIKTILVHSHGALSKKLIQKFPGVCEGNFFPAGKLVVFEQIDDSDIQKSTLKEFFEKYKNTYGKEPNTFAGHAYDALNILAKAIQKSKSLDKNKLRNTIENLHYIGISGIFQFTPKDHNGLSKNSFEIVTLKNNKWIIAK